MVEADHPLISRLIYSQQAWGKAGGIHVPGKGEKTGVIIPFLAEAGKEEITDNNASFFRLFGNRVDNEPSAPLIDVVRFAKRRNARRFTVEIQSKDFLGPVSLAKGENGAVGNAYLNLQRTFLQPGPFEREPFLSGNGFGLEIFGQQLLRLAVLPHGNLYRFQSGTRILKIEQKGTFRGYGTSRWAKRNKWGGGVAQVEKTCPTDKNQKKNEDGRQLHICSFHFTVDYPFSTPDHRAHCDGLRKLGGPLKDHVCMLI